MFKVYEIMSVFIAVEWNQMKKLFQGLNLFCIISYDDLMVIRYVYISILEKEFDTFDAVTISDITMLSIPLNLTYVI